MSKISSRNFNIMGYSGHALVCIDVAMCVGYNVHGYFLHKEVENNILGLKYLGIETDESLDELIINNDYFIGIGNNEIRKNIHLSLLERLGTQPVTLIHPKSTISRFATIGAGSLVMPGVVINAFAKIGIGCIINTGSLIEHDCFIDDFAHIAPGAVLTGNVKIGKRSLIGANSVIKPGVVIGDDVTIGMGSVVLNNVDNGLTIAGNPGRILD